MFYEPDDGADDQVKAQTEELMRRARPEVIEALEQIGLYVDIEAVQANGDEVGLVLGGRLGKLAFSDRVLSPTTHEMDEQFADIAEALVDDDYEQVRRLLAGDDDQ